MGEDNFQTTMVTPYDSFYSCTISKMAVPCVVFVSCSDALPVDIIKGVLLQDILPESLPIYCGSVQTFLWKIDNKYYTADVHLCSVKNDQLDSVEMLNRMEALVVQFDNSKESSFKQVQRFVSLIDGFQPDVQLLVCDNCSQEKSIVSKLSVQDWCLKNGFELVELYSDEPSDSEDDFVETTGIQRIIQALHAHTWSNLVMKDTSNFLSPNYEKLLKCSSSQTDDHCSTEELAVGMKSVKIRDVKSDDSTKRSFSPETDLLDVLGDNIPNEQSFEELFSTFQKMKDKAKDLPFAERKVYAEKAAIAFWRAMGGDEEEIAGLDSDSD